MSNFATIKMQGYRSKTVNLDELNSYDWEQSSSGTFVRLNYKGGQEEIIWAATLLDISDFMKKTGHEVAAIVKDEKDNAEAQAA